MGKPQALWFPFFCVWFGDIDSLSLDNSGLAAVFQSRCENAVRSSDKSDCRCTKTFTDFENLMGFHKSFQPSGKGRTTGSLGDGKHPKTTTGQPWTS
jgi:hypothetical protein